MKLFEYEELTQNKHMMATTAIHKLGDISSDEPDICLIYGETETEWVGQWVYGFGFFDVKFPKDTTRDLTPDEIKEYDGQNMSMSGAPMGKLNVVGYDNEG